MEELAQILKRMERLERENQELMEMLVRAGSCERGHTLDLARSERTRKRHTALLIQSHFVMA